MEAILFSRGRCLLLFRKTLGPFPFAPEARVALLNKGDFHFY